MNIRRIQDDRGAILVIAMIVVTAVALVVGTVLTRGDGSLRATVALRQVAGSTYAADAAAQVAINDLRTGFYAGNYYKGNPVPPAPTDWAFANATGTGCFGYNADGSTVDGIQLPNLYPATTGSGDGPTSAYVGCSAENDTGEQGTGVPINNSNKPGNAVLTLGTSAGEDGFTFKTNGSSGAFRVRGGIWSDSTIVRSNNGTLASSESIRAHSGCTPVSAMSAPVVDCAAGTAPDPNYQSDLDLAATGVPALQPVPSGCGTGSVTLQPGYYDDVTKLNALTPNGGSNCLIHLNPGTYYFDFHNNTADPLFDSDIAASAGDVWNVNSGTIIGGTLTSTTTVPGRCVNPIDDINAQGVQIIFGGDSRMVVDKGAAMELCATYRSSRPPIAVYGQRTGTATSTTLAGVSALTATGVTATSGTFTGATVANVRSADGNQSTNANLAAWVRDGTGSSNALSGSVTMTGFAPATTLPPGTVLTGARLKITHRSTGAQNAITLTPNLGTGLAAYTLPVRTTLGTEDIDLTARSGWGALQKSVHDSGFTGATLKFDASLKRNETSQLDAAQLELTYVLPTLRGETTTTIPGNTVATVAGAPVIQALGNNTVVYIQGTTYVPLASLNLSLNNIAESVFRFGVIARSLKIFETGSFTYPGAVIELPDNSPGWGVNGTLVQLKVYLCPNSATCSPGTGTLSLKARIQLWDQSGTPVPNQRQISVLSWSHLR